MLIELIYKGEVIKTLKIAGVIDLAELSIAARMKSQMRSKENKTPLKPAVHRVTKTVKRQYMEDRKPPKEKSKQGKTYVYSRGLVFDEPKPKIQRHKAVYSNPNFADITF